MYRPMAAPRPSPASGLRGLLQTLPLLPVLAYGGLALVMVTAYEEDAFFGPSCYAVYLGVRCPPARTLWLSLAALWSLCAVTLAVLVVIEFGLNRRGRSIEMPGAALLASGVFVSGLGLLWFWAAREVGWGRVPYALAYALLFAYVTCALFLFGLTFLRGVPRRGRFRGWTVGLATANELVGLVLGFLWADAILHPIVFA